MVPFLPAWGEEPWATPAEVPLHNLGRMCPVEVPALRSAQGEPGEGDGAKRQQSLGVTGEEPDHFPPRSAPLMMAAVSHAPMSSMIFSVPAGAQMLEENPRLPSISVSRR